MKRFLLGFPFEFRPLLIGRGRRGKVWGDGCGGRLGFDLTNLIFRANILELVLATIAVY